MSHLFDLGEINMNDAPATQSVLENVELGVGAWSWGDRLVWGYGRGYSAEDVRQAFEAAIAAGIRMFDTAEVYGQGQSERLLGEFMKSTSEPLIIATKFMPYPFPWRFSRGSLLRALRGSLKRLGAAQVDLYQVHQPLPPVKPETWMEAMAEAVQAGLTREVGVSNYNRSFTQRAYAALAREGFHLSSNQVEYSLIQREIEKDGLLKQCQELGVRVIAYSPMGMGLLTGKYTPDNPPSGIRGGRYNRRFLERMTPLLTLMKRIGSDHAGKTPAQVALNWVICKGALPIPGAKNAAQAEQNAGALGWRLTEEEVAALDEASDKLSE